MDKVFIKDLSVRAVIGINDWEREIDQEILINITMFTEQRKANTPDEIEYCVNYRSMAKNISSHVESIQRFTVEALAEDIAKICLENTLVKKAIVRVEKPGAVRFSQSVGVEIERNRTDE